LARRPTLGRVLDANDYLITRRLDLGLFAAGTSSRSPGLAFEDPEELADAVAGATRTAAWEPTDGHLQFAELPGYAPLHEAVAW
jgi:hypothetical protein